MRLDDGQESGNRYVWIDVFVKRHDKWLPPITPVFDLDVFWKDGGFVQADIHALQFVFLLLLLFVVALGMLSEKLKTPYPIVLVVGGLLLSFIPGIPRTNLNPDIVFFVILPPLLYSAAWLTSWREFSTIW